MKSNSSLCTMLKLQLKQQIKDPSFRNFLPKGTTEIKILYGQMEKEIYGLWRIFRISKGILNHKNVPHSKKKSKSNPIRVVAK
jgi:hypothetical protein